MPLAREDDERLSGEVFRAKRVPFGEPMTRRKQRRQRLALEEGEELELLVLLRVVDDPEVELAALEPLHLLRRDEVRDVRYCVAELLQNPQEPQQTFNRQVRDAADAKRRALLPGAPRFGDGEVERGQDLACLLEEDPPGVGRHHDPARPVEQLDAEIVLELPDRLRQRRLRNVQALGGAAEMELLADRHEVAQVPELDPFRDRPPGVGTPLFVATRRRGAQITGTR